MLCSVLSWIIPDAIGEASYLEGCFYKIQRFLFIRDYMSCVTIKKNRSFVFDDGRNQNERK